MTHIQQQELSKIELKVLSVLTPFLETGKMNVEKTVSTLKEVEKDLTEYNKKYHNDTTRI